MFDIVIVGDEVGREPIEQVLIPGFLVHVVEGFDEAAAHQGGPEAIDERASEPAVFRFDEQIGQAFLSRGAGA